MDASFPMAVVVTGAPLTITVEGASAVVAAEDFVGGLATDDRVQAAFLGDRLVVFARAGGAGGSGTTEATAATPNTLALRDGDGQLKAADGVAADDVVTMSQLPADTGWLDITALSGYTSADAQARKRGDRVDLRGRIIKDSGDFTTSFANCATVPTGMDPVIDERFLAGTPASSSPRFVAMQIFSHQLTIQAGVVGSGNTYSSLYLSGMSWDVV